MWITTKGGKKHPVDVKTKSGFEIVLATMEGDFAEHHEIHESHFATCPKAGDFRKERG
jgi:hypothetical protein